MNLMKTCKCCLLVKDISLFPKRSQKQTLNSVECNQCRALKQREYRVKNLDKIRLSDKKRHLKRRKDMILYCKLWRIKNKQNIREKRIQKRDVLAYQARVKRKNPSVRIRQNLSRRLNWFLCRDNLNKSHSIIDLIGINIKDFKLYLESKFTNRMSWDNYGQFGWHVDHVRPCASFDLTDVDQQKSCFHYTNLQPLWWKDNISKGSKIL
jgi:hypothetical protein